MADVYIKFTPIADPNNATGLVYIQNGMPTYRVDMAGVKIATAQEASDPDLDWTEIKPLT